MCNSIHKTSKQNWEKRFGNKTWGFGYKCFKEYKYNPKKLSPLFNNDIGYNQNTLIKWDKNLNRFEDGFCFFLTIKDAKKYINMYSSWNNWKIRKIRYKKALGCHLETVCSTRHSIAICKEFKILEEVKE